MGLQMIGPEKKKKLEARMLRLGISEADLTEKFIRSSGKGGQNVNKVNTCVFLKHEPSQTQVKCQGSRSQQDNRYFARKLLCDKIENQREGLRSEEQKAREKIRRQKRKRSKRAKEKMLTQKRQRSELKKSRSSPVERD